MLPIGCGRSASSNTRRHSSRTHIEPGLLPSLTAEDLKDLGVSSVGHRRRLLEAIVELRAPASVATVEATTKEPAIGPGAERRQVTVMFCDLVGSTALSARLDLEDLREVIGRYQACIAKVAERHDGFVAKYMGDGALIYFGYPQAHEDDAEQAVRSALAVVDAVGELEASERLQVRVGIASGACRRGRPHRSGFRAGTGDCRADAEPRRPSASAGRAERDRHCREHASPDRRVVRDSRARSAAAERDLPSRSGLGGCWWSTGRWAASTLRLQQAAGECALSLGPRRHPARRSQPLSLRRAARTRP
jgi:adenylate/guanylate cyclase family protein/SAM (Sterile alpha motif) domain-containing protein